MLSIQSLARHEETAYWRANKEGSCTKESVAAHASLAYHTFMELWPARNTIAITINTTTAVAVVVVVVVIVPTKVTG